MKKFPNSESLKAGRLISNRANLGYRRANLGYHRANVCYHRANLYYHRTNLGYHILVGRTRKGSDPFNKYRIHNFQPNDVILFSICVLNSFQFRLLCQVYIKSIIIRKWKEFKTQIENNLTSLGENYFGSIIYFPKIFLDSMFQVMLVILLNIITGRCFLPRIEIMIALVVHVLKKGKVLGGTDVVPTPT